MLKKTKKSIRRLGAVVMALAMAMSVMAINAFAANNPETVTITKTLTKSADAPVPNTTFTFAIAAGDEGVYEQDVKLTFPSLPVRQGQCQQLERA